MFWYESVKKTQQTHNTLRRIVHSEYNTFLILATMVNCTTIRNYEDEQTTLINPATSGTTSTTNTTITTIFQTTTRLIMNTENQTIKKKLTVSKALESTSSTTQQQTTMRNTITENTVQTTVEGSGETTSPPNYTTAE